MKKQVNLKTISELIKLVSTDKLLDLKITAIKGELISEYHISETELGTPNETIIKLNSTLDLLFNALILNKVNSFEMFYSFEKEVFISNHELEYDEILKSDFQKLKLLKENLQQAFILAKNLNMEAISSNSLYEKKYLNNSRKCKYINTDVVRALELLNESFQ